MKVITFITERIGSWYNGTRIPWDKDSFLVILSAEPWDVRRHWTANAAERLLTFIRIEWKWLVGTIIAITGLSIWQK